ncbi:type II secretion system protein GspG [Archangium violaceum]|uniref:type II secretion system protein GspG n=1 Tax=Archangium violaceum TaxID=83451 RepID=UPI001951F2C8|nr:type II secretion system protein GspG [Archangium violaceum]QRN97879.1 type II secretion system protein GspG [Archangium violaceum]
MSQRRRPHFLLIFLPFAFVAIGLVVVLGIRGKHDPAAVQVHSDFDRILAALESWRAERGFLPEEGELSFLVPKYLPAEPVDPWGHPYVFSSDGQRPFLQSLGQDGLRGGNGPNQDHTNHDGHSALAPR